MGMTPVPSRLLHHAHTAPRPTVWRLWTDSLSVRAGESVTYRPGMRITGAVEADLSCIQHNRECHPVSALLRGPDYDVEAHILCVLEAQGEETSFCFSVLDVGIPVYTTARFDSDDFSKLTPISAICSLRLDTSGLGPLGRGLPSFATLTHTWEIAAIHRAHSPADASPDRPLSLRHDWRIEPAEVATLEPFNWETLNAGPSWLFDCRLIHEGGSPAESP